MTVTPTHRHLYIPEPKARPGEASDFSGYDIPDAGGIARPDPTAPEHGLRDYPFGLIRTLGENGTAVGDWIPSATDKDLRAALEAMCLNRLFDDRLFKLQRQGKTSFYMKSRGEEALSVAPSLALRRSDMCFPTYRLVGWLLARGYPLNDLINQIFNNAADPLKGKQLPILYSARDYGFYSLSGNVGSRFGHAVGWAMAKAYRASDDIAIGYIGEGTTAEGDFHEALTFASVYRAPVILCVTNNQWAISSFSGIAGANETTFAAKAIGYGVPGLRVDGNDVLAVWAAVEWAAERARAGLGATLIEFFTYRAEGHSTSDDPSKYRPKDEAQYWPLGDPIARLKAHLIARGTWDDERHAALEASLIARITAAIKESEAIGTLGQSMPSVKEMFEGVFEEPDWRIIEQRGALGV
ncbi:MAG: thiamine pyrophosphate-dependent enzyme [Pseudomonadota bacterium]